MLIFRFDFFHYITCKNLAQNQKKKKKNYECMTFLNC